jgi:hypothetical protein
MKDIFGENIDECINLRFICWCVLFLCVFFNSGCATGYYGVDRIHTSANSAGVVWRANRVIDLYLPDNEKKSYDFNKVHTELKKLTDEDRNKLNEKIENGNVLPAIKEMVIVRALA